MAASRLSRFQGSLVGAVIGDCIGAVFEGGWFSSVELDKIKNLVEKIELDSEKKRAKKEYCYTDDTAMARSVVKSLIKNNALDTKDIAQRFTEEYMLESGRGYGGSVVTVFQALNATQYSDVFKPASDQFDGQGSYGNGGGMRIAPAGLFACTKGYSFEELRKCTENITRITHSHAQAIQGAILQSYAVHQALVTDKLDVNSYLDELISKMKILEEEAKTEQKSEELKSEEESKEKSEGNVPEMPYCHKLEKIREFVNREEQPPVEEINKELGVYIAALDSVPAAIYCFLRATKPIEGLQDRNEFERTIMYSISHGGDTDTVATMAGAIAGAYYGLDIIPWSWQQCCEGVKDALTDAELLCNLKEVKTQTTNLKDVETD